MAALGPAFQESKFQGEGVGAGRAGKGVGHPHGGTERATGREVARTRLLPSQVAEGFEGQPSAPFSICLSLCGCS